MLGGRLSTQNPTSRKIPLTSAEGKLRELINIRPAEKWYKKFFGLKENDAREKPRNSTMTCDRNSAYVGDAFSPLKFFKIHMSVRSKTGHIVVGVFDGCRWNICDTET